MSIGGYKVLSYAPRFQIRVHGIVHVLAPVVRVQGFDSLVELGFNENVKSAEEIEYSRARFFSDSIEPREFGDFVDKDECIFCIGERLHDEILYISVKNFEDCSGT